MSKVICDVCGTTYPETATQCPICGSAKNSAEQTAAGAGNPEESTANYAYVKGGRFSKKNVRRRGQGRSTPTTAQRRSSSARNPRENEEPNNTGLVIVVVLLLVAIAAMLVYLFVTFFGGEQPAEPNNDTTASTSTTQSTTEPSETYPQRIPCTGIQLSNTQLELAVGETWTITTQLSPVDTNDEVGFVSADPTIADVDTVTGEVTMLAEGETVITVICGEITAECVVKTPAPVDPTIQPGVFEFEFNTIFVDENGNGDCTLSAQGATWKAYKSTLDMDPALITWTTDDPAIATIENGVVTAVAPGTTKIHAQYNGVTYSCVIRCAFELKENQENQCIINADDVTIDVGESFNLKLRDSVGYGLEVTWLCDTDGVTIDGNKITGAVSGVHKVYTVYEGETYSCVVRVK